MAVVRNLMVRAGADFSGLQKGMQAAQKSVQSFQESVSKSMSRVETAIAIIGSVMVLRTAVNEAVKVEGAVASLNKILGESAKEFYDWAKASAFAFGMSTSQALDYGRTFAIMTKMFAADSQQQLKYTTDLIQQSAVIASLSGRTMEDVMFRIASGLRGETEAVEDLQIQLTVAMIESTDAFRTFAGDKSWAQLSAQTQAQIRYFALLEQATAIYGNELTDGIGLKINQFKASLSNLNLALGQVFVPILNVILPALTAFIQKLAMATSFIAEFSTALFGSQKSAKDQKKNIENVAGSIKDVENNTKSAAKAQKGFLAGFDEVNSLPTADAGGAGDPGAEQKKQETSADTTGFIDGAIQVSDQARAMAESVKSFFQTLGSIITQNKTIIIASLAGIGAGFAAYTIATNGASVGTSILNGAMIALRFTIQALQATLAVLVAPATLIAAAIAAITAAAVYFYQTNESFRGVVDGIFVEIGNAMIWVYENALKPIGSFISNVFVAAWNGLKKVIEFLWKNVFVPFGNFLNTLGQALTPFAKTLTDVLAFAFDKVAKVAMILWKSVFVPLFNAISTLFEPAVEALSAVFNFLWQHAIQPLANFLKDTLLVIIKVVSSAFSALWTIIKPIASWIADVLIVTFENLGSTVSNIIGGITKVFKGILNFITGVFTGDWTKAFEGLKNIVAGVFDTLVAVVKFPLNLIIEGLNFLIRGLNKIEFDIPSWVPVFGGKQFGIKLPEIPKLADGGIVSQPTIAQVGEAGKEMIVPLENTSFVDKLAGALGTAVMSAMQVSNMNNTNNDKQVVIKIDGNTIARAINPYLTKESGRVGNSLIAIT